MQLVGRGFRAGSGYRYGFNGQEKSIDVAKSNYTAEFWEYDSRIGRRWNLDPIVKPWESGYASFSNNPICFNDPLGLDAEDPKKKRKIITLDEVTIVGVRKKKGAGKNGTKFSSRERKIDFKSIVNYGPTPTRSGLDGINIKPLLTQAPVTHTKAAKINVKKTIETASFLAEHGEVVADMFKYHQAATVLSGAGDVVTGISIVNSIAHKDYNGAIKDGIEFGISKTTAAPYYYVGKTIAWTFTGEATMSKAWHNDQEKLMRCINNMNCFKPGTDDWTYWRDKANIFRKNQEDIEKIWKESHQQKETSDE